MKQNSFLLVSSLVLFLFLFSARANPLHDPVLKTFPQKLHNRAANSEPVLDLAGEEVQTGYRYEILPAIWPNLGPVSVPKFSCVTDVVQAEPPTPFYFTPVDSTQQTVQTGTETFISFPDAWCRGVLAWRIGESNGQAVVRVGPGEEAENAGFIIEKSGISYTLSHCEGGVCRYVGSHPDGKGRVQLALGEHPLLVVFRRTAD